MKKTLGITALVFVLCVTLVGCGGEETHNQDANAGTSIESPLSAASSEIQPLEKANDFENGTIEFSDYGISCKVPRSWVRTDTNDFTYFYPQPPTNTFMMVGFSETSSSVFDSGALDGFVNGVGSGQEFFSEISREEKTTSDGTRYMYVTTSGIIKEVGIVSQIALFDGDGGIITLSMANSTDALKDYRADFENIVNSASVAVAYDSETSAETPTAAPGNTQEAPQTTANTVTIGQKNALSKAKDYLVFTAFSYSGLIRQLEYEGFSTEEATYGADNCGADWNEQAAKKAQEYLEFMSFSRSGLIEQLKYEGFTQEQAEYGAATVGY